MNLLTDGSALLPIISEMEVSGMPASRSHFQSLLRRLDTECSRIRTRISNTYYGGRPFNPKADADVRSLILKLSLQPLKRTKKTRMLSMAADSIGYLQYEHEVIRWIFEWRERQHIRDSFCKKLLTYFDPDGPDIQYIHPRLKPMTVHTRRLAGEDPNPLNIPARSALGLEVRNGFQCEEGEVFGAWDFSQIELRVAAHVSGDEAMCRVYEEGGDIHRLTAAVSFGVSEEEVTKKQRTAAKTLNFGPLYGQGPEGMLGELWEQGQTHWTLAEVKAAFKAREEAYPGMKEYERRVETRVKKTGWVEDMWGMRRYLPGALHPDRHVRSEAIRMAVNHTIQGGAQGLLQKSMLHLRGKIRELQDQGARVCWCLQLHDEIILRFDPELWETMDGMVRDAMINHCGAELSIPAEVDGNMSSCWGDLK